MASSEGKNRPFDLLVYGATGFTGKRVAKHIHEHHPDIRLAIGGRNKEKLDAVANDELGGLPPSSIFVAPTNDPELLARTLSQAKIVLACAGPYRQVGKEIVEAAVAAGTDYLDLCGEPQFFDDILTAHDSQAQKSGVLVVSACAFDCVPAELSAKLVAREVRNRYDTDVVSGIEIVHTFQNVACGNPTTFHAAVDGFHAASNGELKASRNEVKTHFNIVPPPKRPADWTAAKLIRSPGNSPLYDEQTKNWLLRFVGADAACILASDRYLRLRDSSSADTPPPRLSVCFGVGESKSNAYLFLAFGAVFSTLAKYEWGCRLLHDRPSAFSNGLFREGGPTDDELAKGGFVTHSAGYGRTPEERVRVECRGPEPGYVATPAMITALALTVLKHREILPFKGGVMLPGALYGECQEAYDLLRDEGVAFDVVEDDSEQKGERDQRV